MIRKLFALKTTSIRNRLLIQLGLVAVVISLFLFLVVRLALVQAVTATQDRLLAAAVSSVVDKIYVVDNMVSLDLPYDTFSLLGAIGEDRIFYQIKDDGKFLTGYEDLPYEGPFGDLQEPIFTNIDYLDATFRAASIENVIFAGNQARRLTIIIAQSQNFQATVLTKISTNLIFVTFIFLIIAILFAFLTANLTIRPIGSFADDVKMRGPSDLRKVSSDVPSELLPLVHSLNGFISRFRTALRQTETFIAEAAHHIRTPLSVVKSESELALRKSKTPENREHLRNIIRSVDQTNRSATQLLDHAMVLYRAERPEKQKFSAHQAVEDLINQFRPAADLRDLDIAFSSTLEQKQQLYLDRTLLETSLRNLLDNALKYAIAESTVFVDLSQDKKQITVTITNDAANLKDFNASQIFKKFKRGTENKDIIGSGLGLSIVLEAANAINATIKVKKLKGESVCAILSLPC